MSEKLGNPGCAEITTGNQWTGRGEKVRVDINILALVREHYLSIWSNDLNQEYARQQAVHFDV